MTTTADQRPVTARPGDVRPRHRRRILVLVAAAVVVVLVGGTWLVAFSPVLGVRTVTVHGASTAPDVPGGTVLTTAQIRQRADIATGTPLVRLDTAAITRRIETLPQVYSAEVTTSLPSTVTITVTERTAVAYVHTRTGYTLLDRTGAQFESVTSAPTRLPLLVLPAGTVARRTGAALATVAASLPRSLLTDVQSIQALGPGSITLVLTGGRIVHWGNAAADAVKARVLPVMLRKKGQTMFDVSDPGQPFSR